MFARDPMMPADRLASIDQFRGYTVTGMFLVNFLGAYAITPPLLKHNNYYFSYADSIMPSFLFICGCSYRLSALRRTERDGLGKTRWRFVARSLGLVLVSLVVFGVGGKVARWSELTPERAWHLLARLLKADMWEVLAIIGVAQLITLPVITASKRTRVLTLAGLMLAHLGLSYFFNFAFVTGGPNRLDDWLGTTGSTAWDGGTFGLLQWSAILLAGSLAYDVVAQQSHSRAAARLLAWGAALMVVGYGLSCVSRLYDGEAPSGKGDVAASPLVPPWTKVDGRPFAAWLAEPPFVQPPGPRERPNNYWMMNKRVVTASFVFFGTGLASALFGAFVGFLGGKGRGLGLFRTFGTNPLAAYVIHELVQLQVHAIVPKDAPVGAVLVGLAVFATITYVMVRALEKQGLYVRV